MGVQNLDVEFEDYIIFHRGVQEVSFDETDNHLHVIYQDGYDQDMGDPLGDRIDRAETMSQHAEQLDAHILQMKSDIEDDLDPKLATATSLSETAATLNTSTIAIQHEIEDLSENIQTRMDNIISDITGIGTDLQGNHYVDLTSYSTTTETEELVHETLSSMDGISEDPETNELYIDPIKPGSKTEEIIDSKFDTVLTSIDGISKTINPTTQEAEYAVDMSGYAITNSMIQELFA